MLAREVIGIYLFSKCRGRTCSCPIELINKGGHFGPPIQTKHTKIKGVIYVHTQIKNRRRRIKK